MSELTRFDLAEHEFQKYLARRYFPLWQALLLLVGRRPTYASHEDVRLRKDSPYAEYWQIARRRLIEPSESETNDGTLLRVVNHLFAPRESIEEVDDHIVDLAALVVFAHAMGWPVPRGLGDGKHTLIVNSESVADSNIEKDAVDGKNLAGKNIESDAADTEKPASNSVESDAADAEKLAINSIERDASLEAPPPEKSRYNSSQGNHASTLRKLIAMLLLRAYSATFDGKSKPKKFVINDKEDVLNLYPQIRDDMLVLKLTLDEDTLKKHVSSIDIENPIDELSRILVKVVTTKGDAIDSGIGRN